MKAGRILTGLFLVSMALMSSCRRPSAAVEEPVSAESRPEEPRRIIAEVTVDRLRVRSLPYLDEEIVLYLSSGDSILIESRTEWSQQLGEMIAPWYFVRNDISSGWTYGGFLEFAGDDLVAVPINPALPEPDVPVDIENEGFLDPADLPEILLPVFGIEGDIPGLPGGEGTIGYDAMHENLILPFVPGSDSGLAAMARGEASLKLVAEHISGLRYEHVFAPDEASLFSSSMGYLPSGQDEDALLLPFYRLASITGGAWEFYAFAGNDGWPAAIGKEEISPGSVSVVAVDEPNPMADSPHGTYHPGDTAFCFGIEEGGTGYRQVALYYDTEEYRDGKVLLRPALGRRVKLDSQGRWKNTFSMGSDMAEGRYWVAVGDPITGLEDVRLFITTVNISR